MSRASQAASSEEDELVKGVLKVERVTKYIIYNKEGILIRFEGWDDEKSSYKKCVQLAATVSNLVRHCSSGCQELLAPPNNEVESIRLRSKKYEMIVAPSENYTLVAIQESSNSDNNSPVTVAE